MAQVYDVIVIGLGVMGSAAAYHLAKDGQRVLVLEQFELDHRMGSSYGESRIIRYAYDHPLYIEMAKATYPMWRTLEQESGKTLMTRTGGIDFGPADFPSLIETRDSLQKAGIPFEWLTPADVARRFPQFRLDDHMMAVYQADAAYLAASQCVIAQAEQAQKHGATIYTQTKVTRITPRNGSVTVETASAGYAAASLILAAGPWAGKVLGTLGLTLPLQPTREQVVFFNPPPPAADLFTPDKMPVFIYHDTTLYYGLPNVDGNGLKAAVHGNHESVDPDHCKRTADESYIQQVQAWVGRHIPQAAKPISEAWVCLYTMTPDTHFVMDRHPAYPNIAFGAGFSGHGFKFGILIGRILADLATKGATAYDISLFNHRRFSAG